jgi:hypothetical protein
MTSDATESITARISEILTENAENGITECDITLLSKLIMETLNHLSSDN